MTFETTNPAVPADLNPQEQMAWLLNQFVGSVPGVTHAVLASRDGIKQLYSDVTRDQADTMAAALSSLLSLCANFPGPDGEKMHPRQVMIERDDCLIFVTRAGSTEAFPNLPGSGSGGVDTVLGVLAAPDANAGDVGFEMSRLVQQFAPYMTTPVRHEHEVR
ncbi:roadblock/LC7 domain-containing protein [Streptomyces collinus]|uniref:roadblock/LC7 domain-containing protein n=1 Tax=Streptomyces collinus TaxID=42684 RepID=UPI0037D05F25